MSVDDTIFALSSGRPPAAIAVVRISGPRAGAALAALIGRVPEPRRAALARVRDPATGEVIDEGLALWFPAPHSETGEDVAELQMHGGRAVIAAMFAVLGRMDGLRTAEPGEFTRRAFENGQLDLAAAEGLGDLIYAETEAQRRQAYRQMKGWLGEHAESWRGRLIEAVALVEAAIDFPDEGDVPNDLLKPALTIAAKLRDEIAEALTNAARGERLRDGLAVAIAGPVNAGKSTLLNRIARRDAAIVSPHAGTTRDVIEVQLDLDGYPLTLLDTAGIRDSNDPVEQEGVRRARARAGEADLVLWMADASANDAQRSESFGATPVWTVLNKADLVNESLTPRNESPSTGANQNSQVYDLFTISALRGDGVDALVAALARFAADTLSGAETALVTRERHRQRLTEAADSLGRTVALGATGGEDVIAEELRLAARALGRITGRVDVEDILDLIFSEFCIGK